MENRVNSAGGLEKLSDFNQTLSQVISSERIKRKRQKEFYNAIVTAQEKEIEALLEPDQKAEAPLLADDKDKGLVRENKRLRGEVKALKDEIRALFTQLLESVSEEITTTTVLDSQSHDKFKNEELIKELESANQSLTKRVMVLEEQVESLKTDNDNNTTRFEEEIEELRAHTPAVNLALTRKRHEEELRNMRRKLITAEDEIVRLRGGAGT